MASVFCPFGYIPCNSLSALLYQISEGCIGSAAHANGFVTKGALDGLGVTGVAKWQKRHGSFDGCFGLVA
jgi:hypothetical protein